MIALSMCDKPVVNPESRPSSGDTLDIAIEYSPVTYYTYEDTLGGYNYDLLRMMSDSAGCPMKFHPVTLHDLPLPTPSTLTSKCWCSAVAAPPSIHSLTWQATRCGWSRGLP